MAVKIALAVGLFIVICVSPGLKSSQVVPDGLVSTEVKKTLVRGVQGMLTCRFFGDPIAVYWEKGFKLDDLSLMVIWHDGKVSGPRYDDGSCDVVENYSLIINNVSAADAGRIYCKVSNYKGILIKNYTDIAITDTALETNPRVTLQMRQATYGILLCTVHIKARRVSWKRGTISSVNESLVVLNNNEDVVKRSGTGYDEGAYNITHHYSLVIKEVQVQHEGLYVCEVTDFDTGISFQNHSFVNVVALPLIPFPTVQECLNTDQYQSKYCTLVAESEMTLTCETMNYYPALHLTFLHGSRKVKPLDTREWNNRDGTKNKTVTIAASGSKELYTCVAFNIPGTSDNESTSVLLHDEDKFESFVLVIIVILFTAVILISSVAYFIWRKKHTYYSAVPRSAPHLELEDIVRVKNPTQEDFEALEKRVNEVLMQHYRRICDLIETKSTIQADAIISENRIALFKTRQMLIDWRECRTSSRVKETIDIANEPDYAWPSDEELKTISHHLTQETMKKVCKKLKIDCRNDDANDEGKRFEILRKWRTNALHKSLEEKYGQLAPALESNDLEGLLPTLRGPYIYKAELIDLAFHLLMHDLRPVARGLCINVTRLVSYRSTFHSSHLNIGTIKLLIELGEVYKRSIFCNRIASLHYRTVAITGLLDYDMSYGELGSISEVISQNAQGGADQVGPNELGSLQDVLQLSDQEKADCLDTSHQSTVYKLFKIWKEKPRPSFFNYRAALAEELRGIQMSGLADEIIAGTYITERTSLAFIEDMVRGLNQDDIRSLGELLQLSADKEQWHTTTPFNEISKQIYNWVAGWTIGLKGSWRSKFLDNFGKPTAEKHKDLNDKLVEHGFLDLAREIMIIEQHQLNYRL